MGQVISQLERLAAALRQGSGTPNSTAKDEREAAGKGSEHCSSGPPGVLAPGKARRMAAQGIAVAASPGMRLGHSAPPSCAKAPAALKSAHLLCCHSTLLPAVAAASLRNACIPSEVPPCLWACHRNATMPQAHRRAYGLRYGHAFYLLLPLLPIVYADPELDGAKSLRVRLARALLPVLASPLISNPPRSASMQLGDVCTWRAR